MENFSLSCHAVTQGSTYFGIDGKARSPSAEKNGERDEAPVEKTVCRNQVKMSPTPEF